MAYLYLNKRFNAASAEILSWYENAELFLSLNPKHIKEKLTEAGVVQYLLVMKHLSLQKLKKEIARLELQENKIKKLLTGIIK